jgi:hypothetical protein
MVYSPERQESSKKGYKVRHPSTLKRNGASGGATGYSKNPIFREAKVNPVSRGAYNLHISDKAYHSKDIEA